MSVTNKESSDTEGSDDEFFDPEEARLSRMSQENLVNNSNNLANSPIKVLLSQQQAKKELQNHPIHRIIQQNEQSKMSHSIQNDLNDLNVFKDNGENNHNNGNNNSNNSNNINQIANKTNNNNINNVEIDPSFPSELNKAYLREINRRKTVKLTEESPQSQPIQTNSQTTTHDTQQQEPPTTLSLPATQVTLSDTGSNNTNNTNNTNITNTTNNTNISKEKEIEFDNMSQVSNVSHASHASQVSHASHLSNLTLMSQYSSLSTQGSLQRKKETGIELDIDNKPVSVTEEPVLSLETLRGKLNIDRSEASTETESSDHKKHKKDDKKKKFSRFMAKHFYVSRHGWNKPKKEDTSSDEEEEDEEKKPSNLDYNRRGSNRTDVTDSSAAGADGSPPLFSDRDSYIEKIKVKGTTKDKILQDLRLTQVISNAHKGAIYCMEFSPKGDYLATGGQDCILRIWTVVGSTSDAQRWNPKMETTHNTTNKGPNTSASTPGSNNTATSTPNGVHNGVHNGANSEKNTQNSGISGRNNGQNVGNSIEEPPGKYDIINKVCFREFTGHRADIIDLSWSKSDFLLSASIDQTVKLWHKSRARCLCEFKHADIVTSVQFHPLQDYLFLTGSFDSRLRLWNILEHRVIDWVEVETLVTAATFSPNGKYAVCGLYDGQCFFYSTEGFRLSYVTAVECRNAAGKYRKGRKVTGLCYQPTVKRSDKIIHSTQQSRGGKGGVRSGMDGRNGGISGRMSDINDIYDGTSDNTDVLGNVGGNVGGNVVKKESRFARLRGKKRRKNSKNNSDNTQNTANNNGGMHGISSGNSEGGTISATFGDLASLDSDLSGNNVNNINNNIEQYTQHTQHTQHSKQQRRKNTNNSHLDDIQPELRRQDSDLNNSGSLTSMHGSSGLLVTTNDSRIRLYNVNNFDLKCKYKGHSNTQSQIHARFSPNGEYIICGSDDQNIYVWRRKRSINDKHTGIAAAANVKQVFKDMVGGSGSGSSSKKSKKSSSVGANDSGMTTSGVLGNGNTPVNGGYGESHKSDFYEYFKLYTNAEKEKEKALKSVLRTAQHTGNIGGIGHSGISSNDPTMRSAVASGFAAGTSQQQHQSGAQTTGTTPMGGIMHELSNKFIQVAMFSPSRTVHYINKFRCVWNPLVHTDEVRPVSTLKDYINNYENNNNNNGSYNNNSSKIGNNVNIESNINNNNNSNNISNNISNRSNVNDVIAPKLHLQTSSTSTDGAMPLQSPESLYPIKPNTSNLMNGNNNNSNGINGSNNKNKVNEWDTENKSRMSKGALLPNNNRNNDSKMNLGEIMAGKEVTYLRVLRGNDPYISNIILTADSSGEIRVFTNHTNNEKYSYAYHHYIHAKNHLKSKLKQQQRTRTQHHQSRNNQHRQQQHQQQRHTPGPHNRNINAQQARQRRMTQ